MEAFGLRVRDVIDREPVKADAGDRVVVQQQEGFGFVRIGSAQQRSLRTPSRQRPSAGH